MYSVEGRECKGLINKIAAVTSKQQTQKGEVAEFQSLLKALKFG
jgi:hypothetical protein